MSTPMFVMVVLVGVLFLLVVALTLPAVEAAPGRHRGDPARLRRSAATAGATA